MELALKSFSSVLQKSKKTSSKTCLTFHFFFYVISRSKQMYHDQIENALKKDLVRDV